MSVFGFLSKPVEWPLWVCALFVFNSLATVARWLIA
jgi:hypothetical protein